MPKLTAKEQMYLEETLRLENLCIAKYNTYADKCQDEGLKAELFTLSKNKRRNLNRLNHLLGHKPVQMQ